MKSKQVNQHISNNFLKKSRFDQMFNHFVIGQQNEISMV